MSIARLQIPFARNSGVTPAILIANYAVAFQFNEAAQGGFFLAPFRIPRDFDVTRPSTIYCELGPGLALGEGTGVVLEALVTRLPHNANATQAIYQTTWIVPFGWGAAILHVPIDTGAGYTFPAHTFLLDDSVGMLFRRNGPQAADTYPTYVQCPAHLYLDYTSRCRCL